MNADLRAALQHASQCADPCHCGICAAIVADKLRRRRTGYAWAKAAWFTGAAGLLLVLVRLIG